MLVPTCDALAACLSVIIRPFLSSCAKFLLCGTLIDPVEVLGAILRLKDAVLSPWVTAAS